MSAVSFSSVCRAIKRGDLAPVYYLTGDEEILKDELIGAVVNAAVEEATRDFNLDVRTAGDLNGESLYALVETPPMLAARRVAVVKGTEQWRKNSKVWQTLLEYLGHPSPTTTLVLVSGSGHTPDKALAERTAHVAVEKLDRDAARKWATSQAGRRGFTLSPDAASHLIEAVAGNISHAAAELEKLAAATPDGGTVKVSDVERFVGVRHGETLSDWVDTVSQRQAERAIRLLDIVLVQPGNTAVKMLNVLGTMFVATRLARALADQRKNARQVKDALWRVLKSRRPQGVGKYSDEIDSWMAAAVRWRSDELDEALRLIQQTDDKLKSTTIGNPRATLTNMLLRLRLHRSAS